jgi:sec-independent protein translocase protein TatC
MTQQGKPIDPEDYFSDTRMTFGEHLEDLRVHLWRAIWGFVVFMLLSIPTAYPVLRFIAAPVEAAMKRYYERREAKLGRNLDTDPELRKANQTTQFIQIGLLPEQARMLVAGEPAERINAVPKPYLVRKDAPPREQAATAGTWWGWLRWLYGDSEVQEEPPAADAKEVSEDEVVKLWIVYVEPFKAAKALSDPMRLLQGKGILSTLRIEEAFFVYFKVIILCGFVLGSPWIFWQVWQFIAAGLYPHEKRLVHVYLPISLGLFLGGVFITEFFVMPKAIDALLWFNEFLGFDPDLRLSEWLGFAILMPLIFGLCFQTPLVMLFLERVGLFSADAFRGKRKISMFLMAVFAAVITPSTDPVSLLLLWVPMCLLFELGIKLCELSPRPPAFSDTPDDEEMVEV